MFFTIPLVFQIVLELAALLNPSRAPHCSLSEIPPNERTRMRESHVTRGINPVSETTAKGDGMPRSRDMVMPMTPEVLDFQF